MSLLPIHFNKPSIFLPESFQTTAAEEPCIATSCSVLNWRWVLLSPYDETTPLWLVYLPSASSSSSLVQEKGQLLMTKTHKRTEDNLFFLCSPRWFLRLTPSADLSLKIFSMFAEENSFLFGSSRTNCSSLAYNKRRIFFLRRMINGRIFLSEKHRQRY